MSEFEFTEEQNALVEERTNVAFEKIKPTLKYELDNSIDTVPGQNFVVISFAGEKCIPKSDQLAIKIWGAFETSERAMEYCVQIGKLEENRSYNIFVMSMYNWAMCPPELNEIGQIVYHEEKLQTIIEEHSKQHIRSKEMFDLRRELTLCNKEDSSSKVQILES